MFAGSQKPDFQLAEILPCAQNNTPYGAKMATSATQHMSGLQYLHFHVCLYFSCTSKIFIFIRNLITPSGTKEMINTDWQPDLKKKQLCYDIDGEKSNMITPAVAVLNTERQTMLNNC